MLGPSLQAKNTSRSPGTVPVGQVAVTTVPLITCEALSEPNPTATGVLLPVTRAHEPRSVRQRLPDRVVGLDQCADRVRHRRRALVAGGTLCRVRHVWVVEIRVGSWVQLHDGSRGGSTRGEASAIDAEPGVETVLPGRG